jgi:hypothetical protein
MPERSATAEARRSREISLGAWLLVTLVVSCASTNSASSLPPFVGVETERWRVQETGSLARDDLSRAFEASARSYGCNTERLGGRSRLTIAGQRRSYYGISASCEEGVIALVRLSGDRVSIGCAKPTTSQACEHLVRNISLAR